MRSHSIVAISRRFAVGTLAAGAAGLAFPAKAQLRAITLRGMVGGGLAQFNESGAQFSLFATRATFNEQDEEVVIGSFIWVDEAAGYSFTSTEISSYDMLEAPAEQGHVRRVRGTVQLNEGETYPFVLNVTDAGPPASEHDSLALLVGAGANIEEGATPEVTKGFSYAAAGPIEIGDVQDVEFELGTETTAA